MSEKSFNAKPLEAAARHAAFDAALTVDEVSARWRVSNVLVRRLISKGALKSFRVGRCVRVLSSSVISAENGHASERVPSKADSISRAARKPASSIAIRRPSDLTDLARDAQAALERSTGKPKP